MSEVTSASLERILRAVFMFRCPFLDVCVCTGVKLIGNELDRIIACFAISKRGIHFSHEQQDWDLVW